MLLYEEGELCVCELTCSLELSQPKISRHLALLRQCRVLLGRREGQWVYYRINPSLPAWTLEVLAAVITELKKSHRFKGDRKRLKAMKALSGETVCGN